MEQQLTSHVMVAILFIGIVIIFLLVVGTIFKVIGKLVVSLLGTSHENTENNDIRFTDVQNEDTKSSELELPVEKYRYHKKKHLITSAENEIFQLLYEIYGDQYYIFTQVHLSAIFDHAVYGQNWKGALSHIDRKSVDFVICDKKEMQPLLGIELDDLTHKQDDRIERDMIVEQIFNNAGLPLLRIENHGSFSKEEIQHLALEKLNNKPNTN